ncbi:cytochrome b [Moraxella nasicaprae]|uniref:Cytochrome b/b6 domain-containing protein n=1 Tax=Moraxella nasicaprae TaxID=2904122 RepID=A0ABY6F5K4_9GAMM|nr:cytochrome b/b6 domain-containing protein [Moraxella nasicaprae]UXZ05382.1 cytochrome b/b6 domain-containing protein [Moraxella nasicaprae]
MKPDTQNRYGTISRLLHWGIFLGYIAMFATALIAKFNPDLRFLLQPHQALGMAVLVLTVLRIVWAAVNAKKRPKNDTKVKIGHFALYALMLIVPVLGMARNIGRENGNEFLVQLGNNLHGELAMLLLLLIVGHIGLAIFHQIKGEKVLSKMI